MARDPGSRARGGTRHSTSCLAARWRIYVCVYIPLPVDIADTFDMYMQAF